MYFSTVGRPPAIPPPSLLHLPLLLLLLLLLHICARPNFFSVLRCPAKHIFRCVYAAHHMHWWTITHIHQKDNYTTRMDIPSAVYTVAGTLCVGTPRIGTRHHYTCVCLLARSIANVSCVRTYSVRELAHE